MATKLATRRAAAKLARKEKAARKAGVAWQDGGYNALARACRIDAVRYWEAANVLRGRLSSHAGQ